MKGITEIVPRDAIVRPFQGERIGLALRLANAANNSELKARTAAAGPYAKPTSYVERHN